MYDPLYNRETALMVFILRKNILLDKEEVLLMDIARELDGVASYGQVHYRMSLLETFGYVSTTRYKRCKNSVGKPHPQVMVRIRAYGIKRLHAYLEHLLL